MNFVDLVITVRMAAPQRLAVKSLYKTLLFMGRDYPLGYEYFRGHCHRIFIRNSKETDPRKIAKMVSIGHFVVKELEALYMLKKYRTLKSRYYSHEPNTMDEVMRRINDESLRE